MRHTTRVAPLRCPLWLVLAIVLGPATAVLADDLASALDAVEPSSAVGDARDPEALLRLARQGVTALGPLSIGTPDAGLLVNPLPMPAGPYWTLRHPLESYGTAETIAFIVRAIEDVEARFPGSPRLVIGDISRPDGGQLSRHRSHQAGRDADIGFFYARGTVAEFAPARRRDLDLPRTWALVRAFLTDTDVERIFIDRSLIALLYAYARDREAENVEWLDDVFGRLGGGQKGIIQHVRGHKDHMHVRFYNRLAQEYGRVAYPVLVEDGALPPPRVVHRAHRGETLGSLAARFGTTAAAIRRANGMRGTRLRVGRAYVIPVRSLPEEAAPVVVPPRRLPPSPIAFQPVAPEPQLSSGVIHSAAAGGS